MTFKEFLKQKKMIDVTKNDPMKFIDEYYEEYLDFMTNLKDGCSPQE